MARAKAVCARCPVRAECLKFALRALPDGVAGGTTPAERRDLGGRPGVGRGRRSVDRRSVDEPGAVTGASASRREVCAAGRAALRTGRAVPVVAREFGVTERTAYRWAQQVRAQQVRAQQAQAQVAQALEVWAR